MSAQAQGTPMSRESRGGSVSIPEIRVDVLSSNEPSAAGCARCSCGQHSSTLELQQRQPASSTNKSDEAYTATSPVGKDAEAEEEKQKTTIAASHALPNPAPLGLAAFALTTFVLSIFNAEIMKPDAKFIVLPLALWFGGIAQILAGMWEFHIASTFGATAFTSYGCFWLSFATLEWYVVPYWVGKGISGSAIADSVGLYLLCWTIFSLYMCIGAYRISKALFTVFLLLMPALTCLTIGAFSGTDYGYRWTRAGGAFGLLCALSAWYLSAAGIINGVWQKEMLPIGAYPTKSGRQPPSHMISAAHHDAHQLVPLKGLFTMAHSSPQPKKD